MMEDEPQNLDWNDVSLYQYHISYFSHKARIAMALKGMKWKDETVNLANLDNIRPWYMRINPAGSVPTLKVGKHLVPDSGEIIKFLDKYNIGVGLQSNDEKVNRLLARVEEFAPALMFQAMLHHDMVTNCQIPNFIKEPFIKLIASNRRRELMEKMMKECPDLQEAYTAKLQAGGLGGANVLETTLSRAETEQNLETAKAIFKEVEEQMNETYAGKEEKDEKWIFGDNPTLVDVYIAVQLNWLKVAGWSAAVFESGSTPRINRLYQRLLKWPPYKKITTSVPLGGRLTDMKVILGIKLFGV